MTHPVQHDEIDVATRRGSMVCMQVFAQPIFETVEAWILAGKYRLATERPILARAVVRCSYVALTCFLAILIPFFGDLMGCADLT